MEVMLTYNEIDIIKEWIVLYQFRTNVLSRRMLGQVN